MAETSTSTSDTNSIALANHLICKDDPRIINFGWMKLYEEYKTNTIRILDTFENISRLNLLLLLCSYKNNLKSTISEIQRLNLYEISLIPEAVKLTTNLKEIVLDADPVFLDLLGEVFACDHNHKDLNQFIEKITSKTITYPKLQSYNDLLKRIKIINNVSKLFESFNVENFLSMCPDPVNYFKNVKRSRTIQVTDKVSYLGDRFDRTPINTIRLALEMHNYSLSSTFEYLEAVIKKTKLLKNKRKKSSDFVSSDNIEFLKEIIYINHKDEILNHLETQKSLHRIQLEKAKSAGNLFSCQCCYDDELLASEVYSCSANHYFCSSCIKKSVEIAVGENKMDFKCLAVCNEEFNLSLIKNIVDDNLYQKIIKQLQAQEIKGAGIEGLESCAFCDYSVILSPEVKTINCLNPECKKETCRVCRRESHFPYKCNHLETAPEVQVRTLIENKMTEVLIRSCSHCDRKFVKDDGCNKMRCYCGKIMCYICRKPVEESSNYQHFYHPDIIQNKCPLFTDENIVHNIAVEVAAKLIINELKQDKPELLKNINIDNLLPTLKKTHQATNTHFSNIDVNKLVATIIGQNVEDVNNLRISSLEPPAKKTRL